MRFILQLPVEKLLHILINSQSEELFLEGKIRKKGNREMKEAVRNQKFIHFSLSKAVPVLDIFLGTGSDWTSCHF